MTKQILTTAIEMNKDLVSNMRCMDAPRFYRWYRALWFKLNLKQEKSIAGKDGAAQVNFGQHRWYYVGLVVAALENGLCKCHIFWAEDK